MMSPNTTKIIPRVSLLLMECVLEKKSGSRKMPILPISMKNIPPETKRITKMDLNSIIGISFDVSYIFGNNQGSDEAQNGIGQGNIYKHIYPTE